MMQDGTLEHLGDGSQVGSDGTFELLATFEPVRIRAVHASGMVEVLKQPDEEIGTLELRAVGEAVGTARAGRAASGGQQLDHL